MDYETAKSKIKNLRAIIKDSASTEGEKVAANKAISKLICEFDIKQTDTTMGQPKHLSEKILLEIRKLFPHYALKHIVTPEAIQLNFASNKNNFEIVFNEENRERLLKILRAKYLDIFDPIQNAAPAITTMQKQRLQYKTWNIFVEVKDYDITD